ncbi:12961_t:CDS:2, partial [Cetraspora pellucida]
MPVPLLNQTGLCLNMHSNKERSASSEAKEALTSDLVFEKQKTIFNIFIISKR